MGNRLTVCLSSNNWGKRTGALMHMPHCPSTCSPYRREHDKWGGSCGSRRLGQTQAISRLLPAGGLPKVLTLDRLTGPTAQFCRRLPRLKWDLGDLDDK
jgi:hypothetical protein